MGWADEPKDFRIEIQVPLTNPVDCMRFDVKLPRFPENASANDLLVSTLRQITDYIASRRETVDGPTQGD